MIVIADDITGAAEIAGIAFSKGQEVRLACGGEESGCGTATNGTTVIATDTRSIMEAEAVAETRRITSPFRGKVGRGLLFKKTDSALRGHVLAELTALMEAMGYQRAVYLPANPSKGRVIRGGVYYINDVPISETAFSYDPEFPAKTSILEERFPDAKVHNIIMPDAESKEDIRRVITTYNDGKTLFAGAADLFAELIEKEGVPSTSRDTRRSSDTRKTNFSSTSTLILCGSTQSKPLDIGIPIAPMPVELYDGSDDLSLWDTSAYDKQHSVILTVPHTHRTGKDVAVHLRTTMAEMAKQLIDQHLPAHLIIEGGATAWATLQALGWSQFEIVAQLAPGVVQMKSVTNGTLVTLKPGSYPWGGLLESATDERSFH